MVSNWKLLPSRSAGPPQEVKGHRRELAVPAALGPDDREVLRRDVREAAQVRVHAPEDARKPFWEALE